MTSGQLLLCVGFHYNIIHYHTINMTLHPIESNALGYADTCHIKGPLVFLKICDELRICIL